jgi:hypothetical protein
VGQHELSSFDADHFTARIPCGMPGDWIERPTMAEEKRNPESKEKSEPKELRDLKPRKDVKGGAGKREANETRSAGKTGEIDFMNWD